MADITMCSGEGCKQKKKCYRFLAKPDKYQSFFSEPPFSNHTGKCTEFWECKSKSDKKRLDVACEL